MAIYSQSSRKKIMQTWLSSLILILSVGAAAFGVLTGISPEIMISGAALALIIWELSGQIVYEQKDEKSCAIIFSNWAHIRLLVFSVGIGLVLAESGLQIQLSVPFGIIFLAVMLILFSLYRFYQLITR